MMVLPVNLKETCRLPVHVRQQYLLPAFADATQSAEDGDTIGTSHEALENEF